MALAHYHSAIANITADSRAPAAANPVITAGMNHWGGRLRRDFPVMEGSFKGPLYRAGQRPSERGRGAPRSAAGKMILCKMHRSSRISAWRHDKGRCSDKDKRGCSKPMLHLCSNMTNRVPASLDSERFLYGEGRPRLQYDADRCRVERGTGQPAGWRAERSNGGEQRDDDRHPQGSDEGPASYHAAIPVPSQRHALFGSFPARDRRVRAQKPVSMWPHIG